MSGYVLWGGTPSRSMLVEIVLREAGVVYEVRKVDFTAGDHRSEAFLAQNPFGWVPALTTPDGETLFETPAINLWICETHQLDLVPPPGHALRGRFLSFYHNVIGEIEPTLKRVFFAHRYALRPEDVTETRTLAWRMFDERLAPIEKILTERGPYFLGDTISLADITLAYWAAYADREGRLSAMPSVVRLLHTCQSRAAAAPVFAELNASIDRYYATLGKS